MLKSLVLILSLIALCPEALAKDLAVDTAAYYPLKLNNRWEYLLSTQGKQVIMTNEVTKQETEGQPMFRIDTSVNGKKVANEHLLHNEKGLLRSRYNGIEMDPALPLLQKPIKLGTRWSTELNMLGQDLTILCQLGEKKESIQVPAGKFEVIKLDVETRVEGQSVTTTYWFAQDVGIVKQKMDIAGQKAEIELQSFKAAK